MSRQESSLKNNSVLLHFLFLVILETFKASIKVDLCCSKCPLLRAIMSLNVFQMLSAIFNTRMETLATKCKGDYPSWVTLTVYFFQ